MDLQEIDALVAEKVMGWPVSKLRPVPGGVWVSKPIAIGHSIPTVVPFRPSSDITYAWQVVEKMRELGWDFHLDCDAASSTWYAEFSALELGRGISGADADSAPYVVCLAALHAYEVEVPTEEAHHG